MAYYATDITISRIDEIDLGLVVTAHTQHPDRIVQCYVSGDLVAWQQPEDGVVCFVLQQAASNAPILLLAVDTENKTTDYWSDAFGTADTYGNRIQVDMTLAVSDARKPGDKWRVYRGAKGGASATTKLHEADVFPGGRGAYGWGFNWGSGAWGYSASNTPGWGYNWGYDWGFGVDYLRYITPPLVRGTYPIKVEVEDLAGNVSTASESIVVVDTYARPADDLAVSAYTQGSDTLALTQTPSEDIA